jgi:hypothetical protein
MSSGATIHSVHTTGVNIEGVLANAVVIVGFLGALARVCWRRVKRDLREQAEEFLQPTTAAVVGLTSAMDALRLRVDQLEAQRVVRAHESEK